MKKQNLPIFLLLLLITIIVSAYACRKETGSTTVVPTPADTTHKDSTVTTGKTYKYLALGDSYTIGQSVADNERFPAQTAALLKADSININNIRYIAVTGWTTINLMDAINAQNPPADFDIVTLLIGVNDQYQGLDTAGYKTRFTQLLNKAVQLAGNRKARVFVLSIPDYSVTPFVSAPDKARVSMEIDQFNAINKEVTLQTSIAYIDITPSTRQAANDPSLIANDGLHPSGKEYKKWAEMLAPMVKMVLK